MNHEHKEMLFGAALFVLIGGLGVLLYFMINGW